ncbi:thioesterase [Anaerosporomusa subterranea]|uniref:Acyl-coenzyme A thioesterase THEM4 n=1 Tax=Anaerosporomusa subterranea TaxID=1794912 RepID=A0A154BNI6_ANASB|nr:PaaI family thioesterase [Anaerosporomusa subterranea]KYZ75557.1 thioesterase [Anaerosporomusa subterranea]
MSDQNSWCFVCGEENPIGLHLTFSEENETYISTFTPGPEHQSYNGVLHGGIISTLLDEIMARYLYAKGQTAVTAKLEVRFRAPTPIGQPLTIRGRIVGQKGSMYEMAGSIALADGTITAESKALIAIV